MSLSNYAKKWHMDFILYLAETNDFRIVGKPYSKNNMAISFDDMEIKIPVPQPAFERSYTDNEEDDFNDFN